jgi:hypothetical protein
VTVIQKKARTWSGTWIVRADHGRCDLGCVWFGFLSAFAFEKTKPNDPIFSQVLLEKAVFIVQFWKHSGRCFYRLFRSSILLFYSLIWNLKFWKFSNFSNLKFSDFLDSKFENLAISQIWNLVIFQIWHLIFWKLGNFPNFKFKIWWFSNFKFKI